MKFLISLLITITLTISAPCPEPTIKQPFTQVEYFGKLYCPRSPWCAMIYYVERDDLSPNDELDFIRLRCSHTKFLNHHVFVHVYNNDGIQFDRVHEIGIEIYTDCLGDVRRYDIPLRDVNTYLPYINYNYTFGLAWAGYSNYNNKTARSYHLRPNEDRKETEMFFDGVNVTQFPKLYESNEEEEAEQVCD